MLHIFRLHLVGWVKIADDDILKYFTYFSQKTGFGISCKLFALNIKGFFLEKK